MFIFISSFIVFNVILFLWMLLISSSKSKSNEEKFIEDNLQMQYLKEFVIKKRKVY